MTTPEERLQALDVALPVAAAPVANYVPYVRSGTCFSWRVRFPARPTANRGGGSWERPWGGKRGTRRRERRRSMPSA